RTVTRAQPLQCGWLVGSEVINVRSWMIRKPRNDEVDRAFTGDLFLCRIERPILLEGDLPASGGRLDSCQILQAVLTNKRVSFVVQEHVPGRRLGQTSKSSPRLRLQEFDRR